MKKLVLDIFEELFPSEKNYLETSLIIEKLSLRRVESFVSNDM